MNYAERAREDRARTYEIADKQAESAGLGELRRLAIAANGKVMPLKWGGRCIECGEWIDAGDEALWFPTRTVAHLRFRCPARPEYRRYLEGSAA